MPVVVINNLQEEGLFDDGMAVLLTRVAEEVLAAAGYDRDWEVSLVLTGDDQMRELNRSYRGVDEPTDVLSFSMVEGVPMPDAGDERVLGDVVISLPTARRQAEEYGHSLARELAYLTAHGVLHLVGYEHDTEAGRAAMRAREEAVLKKLGLLRQPHE